MNPRTIELLDLLKEECAEVIAAASKTARFGPECFSPFDPSKTTNAQLLNQELGDIFAIVELLLKDRDIPITLDDIILAKNKKREKLPKWMKHPNALN